MKHLLQTVSSQRGTVPVGALRRATSLFCTTLLLLLACLGHPAQAQTPDADMLRRMAGAKVDTGVKPNQIPSLSGPTYLPVADAALSMDGTEQVFVARIGNTVRIYPQRIMVYHEVVNDVLDGTRVSITYSPLTGALVGYMGRAGRFETSFGVHGSLLNANTILFDRATGSLWPQLFGYAIEGPLLGTGLERLPLIWTTWERAARTYPNARVLSRSTGFNRRYGSDPYGSYNNPNSYYHTQSITYPVSNTDDRLPPKERIMGIELGGLHYAIPYAAVQRMGVVNFTMGITPMVAVWDTRLATVRVFECVATERTLEFFADQGKLLDLATRSEWTFDGEAQFGVLRGSRLKPVAAIDCMWFAWAAFYPNAEIIPRQ